MLIHLILRTSGLYVTYKDLDVHFVVFAVGNSFYFNFVIGCQGPDGFFKNLGYVTGHAGFNYELKVRNAFRNQSDIIGAWLKFFLAKLAYSVTVLVYVLALSASKQSEN